jgi:HEAT repeat protein
MSSARPLTFALLLSLAPALALAQREGRWLDDRDFVEPLARGPRPLLYYATSGYYSDPRMFFCGGQVAGGKWWDPAFVLYSDGTVIFLRKASTSGGLIQYHSVRLTAAELAAWRRTVGASAATGLRGLRDAYDAMPGTHHGIQDQAISWLDGQRKTVHVHGMGIARVAFVSKRRQGEEDAVPPAMIELRDKLLKFDHPRAVPWAPRRSRLRLTPATSESESSFRKMNNTSPVTLRWLASWPSPLKAKHAANRPQGEVAVELSRRQLVDLVGQLRAVNDCVSQHLVLVGPGGAERRFWLALPVFELPEEQLWQDERASIPELIGLLQRGDAAARGRAVWRLTRAAWRGVEVHLRLLRHRSHVVRALAASALGEAAFSSTKTLLAPALPALTAAMRGDPEELVHLHAAVARVAIGGQTLVADALPILSRALTGAHEPLRLFAAQELRRLGEQSGPAAPALRAALADKLPTVRAIAALTLLRHRPAAHEALAVAALAAVLSLGPLPKEQALGEVLRSDAARALGKVRGAARDAALAAVRRALGDRDYQVRGQAAEALTADPQRARSAIPALIRIVLRDTGYARDAALRILRALKQQPQILTALRAGLRAADADVRYSCANELGGLKRGAVVAVPDLIAALRDEKVFVRAASAAALGEIGEATTAVQRALDLALHDREDAVRGQAQEALSRLRARPK